MQGTVGNQGFNTGGHHAQEINRMKDMIEGLARRRHDMIIQEQSNRLEIHAIGQGICNHEDERRRAAERLNRAM